MTSPHEAKTQWVQQEVDVQIPRERKRSHNSLNALPSFTGIARQAVADIRHDYPAGWRLWAKQFKEKRRLAKEAKKAKKAAAALAKGSALPTQSPFHPSVAHLPRNLSANHLPAQTPFNNLAAAFSNLNLSQSNQPLLANMSNMQSSQTDNGGGNNQPALPRGILKPEVQRYPSTNNGFPPWQGMPMQPPTPAPTMPQNLQQSFSGYPPQVGYGAPNPYSSSSYQSNPYQPTMTQNFGQPHPQMSQLPPHGHILSSQASPQMPPGPTQPHGGWPIQSLPRGARAMSPPRYPTADDLKYKCAVCNRFRSAGYHYRHPLPPGQLPPKTICRKCRTASSDSEDDSRDGRDMYSDRTRRPRSRSRSVRRIESVGPYLGRASSQRGRSLSRTYSREDHDWYANENRRLQSPSRSTSTDSIPRALSRARSRSVVSRVRIQQPVTEEIVVVKRPRHVRRVIYVDDNVDDSGDHATSDRRNTSYRSTSNRYPRPPTPAPRRMRSQRSQPDFHSPDESVRSGYFDDTLPRRASSRHPQQPSSGDHYQSYSSEQDNDWYANAGRGSGEPSRQYGSYRDYDREMRTASGRRPDTPIYEHGTREHEDATRFSRRDGTGTSSSYRPMERPASRARMSRPPVPDPPMPNQGSTSASEDYDYFDKDGMRVRVREI